MLFELIALGTLARQYAHHLTYQGGPKSHQHTFFVMANLGCFDLGTSLPENVMFKHMAIYVCDRQTDIYILQNTVCRWAVFTFVGKLPSKCMSVNCLVASDYFQCLNSGKRTLANHYLVYGTCIFCGYDTISSCCFFCGGGMPDCKATDWLPGICSCCISHMESVLSFWMEPPLFRCLKL